MGIVEIDLEGGCPWCGLAPYGPVGVLLGGAFYLVVWMFHGGAARLCSVYCPVRGLTTLRSDFPSDY